MIDTTKLKELIQLMVDNDLAEVDLQDEHETVTIKWSTGAASMVQHTYGLAVRRHAVPREQRQFSARCCAPRCEPSAIESPMVGTFLLRSKPTRPRS